MSALMRNLRDENPPDSPAHIAYDREWLPTYAAGGCTDPNVRGRLTTHQVAASPAARRGLLRVLIRTYSLAA